MTNLLSMGVIGGADGPTAIFVTVGDPWGFLLLVAGVILLGWFLYLKFRKK